MAALSAMGNAKAQLKVHLNAVLNVGVPEQELSEIMILLSVYEGFPSAFNATLALKEILKDRTSND